MTKDSKGGCPGSSPQRSNEVTPGGGHHPGARRAEHRTSVEQFYERAGFTQESLPAFFHSLRGIRQSESTMLEVSLRATRRRDLRARLLRFGQELLRVLSEHLASGADGRVDARFRMASDKVLKTCDAAFTHFFVGGDEEQTPMTDPLLALADPAKWCPRRQPSRSLPSPGNPCPASKAPQERLGGQAPRLTWADGSLVATGARRILRGGNSRRTLLRARLGRRFGARGLRSGLGGLRRLGLRLGGLRRLRIGRRRA